MANSWQNQDFIHKYKYCGPCNPCKTPLGIENPTAWIEQDQLSVFPNPIKSNFTIQWYSIEKGKSRLEIFDANAMEIHEQSLESIKGSNQKEVSSMASLPSGIYFLRFTFPSGIVKQKRLIHLQD
ncbi:MAG: T9SS type A sorting domain-containing protein [Saprospiraceae bacterium]|nr:T9SS type A sorting domain-containing protein [Saprospiraceae bacterium]